MSVFDPSNLLLIYGRMGSGKTDITNLLSGIIRLVKGQARPMIVETNKGLEIALEPVENNSKGHHILSNINIRKGLEYHHIASDRDFLTLRSQLEGPISLILDEANLIQSSKRAMTDPAHFLEQLTSIIGHFKTSMIYVIQRKKNYLPFLREMATGEIEKLTKKVAYFKYNGFTFPVRSINSCRLLGIEYQRESFASWQFETNLEAINHYIAKNQMEYEDVIRFLNYHSPDFEKYLLENKN